MKSIFDITEVQLGRQFSDAEMKNSTSIDFFDLTDMLTKLMTQTPSNGSDAG